MTDLTPKQQFLDNDTLRTELAQVVQSKNFHESAQTAFIQWVWVSHPTQEQIAGAKAFLRELLGLPFKERPLPTYPNKRLDHSAYDRPQP